MTNKLRMRELIGCGVLIVAILYVVYKYLTRSKRSLDKKHVVITGGSSGIGKAVAIEVARMGANVTLIARNEEKLHSAKLEVMRNCIHPEQQKVQYFSVDVSENYEAIEKALDAAEEDLGPVYMLVNCAGMAICGKLEDTNISDIKYLMNLNYFGSLYPTKVLVPRMKCRGEGIIVMVSSQAGLLGIYGLSAYSATKFALRGLAEALHMECKPYNVSVTLALPPDTDTPGLANEEKTKPLETRLISESAGLIQPEVVAKRLVVDALNGTFYSTVGFESFMLKTLCCGMTPVVSLEELFLQVFLMGGFRLISSVYLASFHRIIKNCMKTRDTTKKAE
ncbi:Dehydrogenase/reductase SDR family protein 7-like [Gryllus bimaculatus]|nr:Dehydrogenase/reductase SDR family protein 7-like [Gryllus bimaculatus]